MLPLYMSIIIIICYTFLFSLIIPLKDPYTQKHCCIVCTILTSCAASHLFNFFFKDHVFTYIMNLYMPCSIRLYINAI